MRVGRGSDDSGAGGDEAAINVESSPDGALVGAGAGAGRAM